MAGSMKFDLVSPERLLASGTATSVRIPGSEGQMTAMPDHAPTITTLRPGILTVEMEGGTQEFAVTGGFAEISGEGVSVLAERAYPKGADNRAEIEAQLAEEGEAVLYVSGEESVHQIKMRADRIGIEADDLDHATTFRDGLYGVSLCLV